MANQSRYREIHFIGGRILQDRELNLAQSIEKGYDSTNEVQLSYGQTAVYRQGALMNTSVQGSGLSTAVISAIDGTKPMLIFVRDRWEPILNAEANPITLPVGSGTIYLNWELAKITYVEDPQLTDVSTGEPTAEMGELRLTLSTTDTSGTSLSSSQLDKNLSPIVVATYTGSGSSLVITIPDAVNTQAVASPATSGLVKLTGTSPNGIAAGNDDSRLSDERTPLANSVDDTKVTTPTPTGLTNADGTPEYAPQTPGISAVKILLQTGRQTLEAGWNAFKASYNSLLSAFNAHKGAVLGLSNTHPMPTASDVGATPISHVGQPLNLSTSHPATVNQNSGGFKVNRDSSSPAPDDPGYGIFQVGSLIGGILHDGDFMSMLAGVSTVSSSDGDGARTNTGSLDRVSKLALVLAEHVNKVSHKNPHGLAPGDIGAATTGYVDTAVAAVLAQAETYTDTKVPQLSLRFETVTNGAYLIARFAPNNGNAIELAFGSGTMQYSQYGAGGRESKIDLNVPVPVNFSTTNWIGNASIDTITRDNDNAGGLDAILLQVTNPAHVHSEYSREDDVHSQPAKLNTIVRWFGIAWRQNA